MYQVFFENIKSYPIIVYTKSQIISIRTAAPYNQSLVLHGSCFHAPKLICMI